MRVTVKSKLITTEEQNQKLLQTMIRFNEACNYVSQIAFEKKVYNKYVLQKLLYYDIRERFQLSADNAILVVRKVAGGYEGKADKEDVHKFRPLGAMTYGCHTVSYLPKKDILSILTLEGRIKVGIKYGDNRQFDLRTTLWKESDLVYKKGIFYLTMTLDIPEPEVKEPIEFIGNDLGQTNICATSDGKIYSSEKCEKVRQRYNGLRATYQKVDTYSAKKHLMKISKKERRFKKDTNHCISKDLVSFAKDTGRGLAFENLTGIRDRTTARKQNRDAKSKWAYGEIRSFTEYKAREAGVSFVLVDPRYTSQQCSVCGHTEKANRKTQSEFRCKHCGHTDNADINAAKNIASRAVVNQPNGLTIPIVFYLSPNYLSQGFETQAIKSLA